MLLSQSPMQNHANFSPIVFSVSLRVLRGENRSCLCVSLRLSGTLWVSAVNFVLLKANPRAGWRAGGMDRPGVVAHSRAKGQLATNVSHIAGRSRLSQTRRLPHTLLLPLFT